MLLRIDFQGDKPPAFPHGVAARLGGAEQLCFLQHRADICGLGEYPCTAALAATVLMADRRIENRRAFVEFSDVCMRARTQTRAKIQLLHQIGRHVIGGSPIS